MRHLDLFSGIGGFALAADWVWPDVEHTFVEIDPFCQKVLRKHWPNAKIYDDIRKFVGNAEIGTGEEIGSFREGESSIARGGDRPFELLTGGFPCQPFSHAGKRQGRDDDRYLWPEMLRVIRETNPTWIVAENVRGLLSQEGGMVFEQVCLDLEGEGYEVQPFVIPACAVNAPHRRDRVWIVANSIVANRNGEHGEEYQRGHQLRYAGKEVPLRRGVYEPTWETGWLEVATRLCRVDDGLSRELDRRNQSLGNAIVPQVAYEIFRAIREAEA